MKQRFLRIAPAGLMLLLAACATKPDFSAPETHPAGQEWTMADVTGELGGGDPIEPFNRSMFAVNDVLMQYLVCPISWVYGSILPEQAIRRIDMASDNLAFPGRMVSCFLQAKWKYGGTEFLRFLTNTTIGIAGFFDPAEAWFDLPRRHENMGHAFASWGIGPGCLFVLPVSTATNPRDQVGALFDSLLDIKFIIPYAQSISGLNRVIRSYDSYNSLTESSLDVYETFKMSMLALRYTQLNDFPDRKPLLRPPMEKTSAPLPEGSTVRKLSSYYKPEHEWNDTLRVAYFSMQENNRSWWIKTSLWNTDFISEASTRSIRFSDDLPKLRYRLWEKSGRKTLAVIVPGVGTHYTGKTISAFAELLNRNGYAVAAMSSSMNWVFAESSGVSAPGYVPEDAEKVRTAIRLMLSDIRENTDLKEFKLVLFGYSLGGLHVLKIAEMEKNENTLHADRYVALNPPVDLLKSMMKFDLLAALSKSWNRKELFRNADEVLMKYLPRMMAPEPVPVQKTPEMEKKEYEAKVAEARKNGETELPKPPAPREYRLNLHPDQAGVLIGLSFRLTLRELILSAARRELLPPGTVKTPYSWFNRAAFYKEIDRFNGMDYVEKFVQARHPELSLETMRTRSGLRSSAEFLRRSPEIRVLHNADDPILDQEDIRFLNETLKERITWFDCGGHLGNLYLQEYQKELLAAFALPEEAVRTAPPNSSEPAEQTAPPKPSERPEQTGKQKETDHAGSEGNGIAPAAETHL